MQTATKPRSPQRFLDPEILSRITNLELLAKTVVEGFIAGLHKSPYRGFSVEFMEYRQYVPGDDPKRLDWKVYARSDRLFIKEFEDETNTNCYILLDVSNSMGYASEKVIKFDYASYLAASLAYFMIRQRDSVGLYLFDHKLRTQLRPKSSSGHLHTILTTLETTELGTKSEMKKPFDELADAIKRRGIVIIISDLLDDPDSILDGIKHFNFNGNEVLLFHILDPKEVEFSFNDIVEIEDMETGEKLMVMGEVARKVYQRNLNDFIERLKWQCGVLNIDYSKFVTDQPLDFALFKYLAARARRK
ncbi:DUF58 domain-containing protein [candidate division KSB1 bacterium]